MQRRLDKLSVTPMLGFTVAGCSDFTAVVDLGNGTELLDEGCHGEAVGAFTTVIETDPPGRPLIRCIGSHVARHSVLSLLPGPRAASASGAETGRRDEP